MKYAITHCYTDKNKGDAAIIVSTAQLINKLDIDAKINMYSTFGPNDKQYHTEHDFIKNYCDKMYPGMFYQPCELIKGSDKSRFFHFLWIFLKFSILFVTANKYVLSLLFKKVELEGIKDFLDSDIIISKGGSYITAQNSSLRQSLSLFTMLYPFFLSKRYGKKMVIYSQSLGPVSGFFNIWMVKVALKKIKKIYLREDKCIAEYKEISALQSLVDMEVIPDTAFSLECDPVLSRYDVLINENNFNVGMTLVDHAFKYIYDDNLKKSKIINYRSAIIASIEFMVRNYGAHVHIFPQVIVNNSHLGHSDVRMSREVVDICNEKGIGDFVVYHEGDFNPMQLKEMYRNMDMFIGTRLHSVIFSLSCNVPSINIAYHGTKSQGILGLIQGFEDKVVSIDDLTEKELISKIEDLYMNRDTLRDNLDKENIRLKDELNKSMSNVINLSRGV